jgi:hypothetical protein
MSNSLSEGVTAKLNFHFQEHPEFPSSYVKLHQYLKLSSFYTLGLAI